MTVSTFCKNVISHSLQDEIVSQQSRLTIFGAVASVAALFYWEVAYEKHQTARHDYNILYGIDLLRRVFWRSVCANYRRADNDYYGGSNTYSGADTNPYSDTSSRKMGYRRKTLP